MGTHGLQLSDAAMESAAAMGIELRHYYSCRRRLRHHSIAGRHENPTIYKPETQIRGSPTLPPPRRPAEREGTDGLAGGETRESGFSFSPLASTVVGRGEEESKLLSRSKRLMYKMERRLTNPVISGIL
jgi:hypothetical protein